VHRELVLAAAFVGMGVWEILELVLLEAPRRGVSSVLAHATQVAVVLVAAAVVLKLWRQKTAHAAELARLVESAAFARDEERRRVGYDLHDGIAPLIVSAQQHLDTCQDAWTDAPPGARHELGRAAAAVRAAITETRRVMMALRPAALESTGLADAVRTATEAMGRATGWEVSFDETVGPTRLPPAVEVAAFRIFQEAVENARRHARCDRLSIALRRLPDAIELVVADDGVGFVVPTEGAPTRGLGLSSMRERARLLGGRCQVTSHPGRGTRVEVSLPCAQVPA
jgi:two-component system NarL family sensor kinase